MHVKIKSLPARLGVILFFQREDYFFLAAFFFAAFFGAAFLAAFLGAAFLAAFFFAAIILGHPCWMVTVDKDVLCVVC